MSENEEMKGIGSLILIGLIAWGVYSFFSEDETSDRFESESYSEQYQAMGQECIEPENPYDIGSGHYAGWNWGEQGNYCSGNSNSFIEGCEEYEEALSDYEICLNR